MTDEWREGLLVDLQALGHEVDGRVLRSAPPGATVVLAARFLDREYLRDAIVDCGEALCVNVDGDPEVDVKLAAAASRFVRHYLSSLTAASIVALARGVGLDLGPERCVRVVEHGLARKHLLPTDDAGVVTCAERPADWRVDGGESVATLEQLRERVWGRLYGAHLAPLIEGAGELTGATARVLWTNAAEWVVWMADTALDRLGPVDAGPIREEAAWLLEAPSLPGVAGPNPLTGLINYVPIDDPDFPQGVQTRRHCCMTYVLPSRVGLLCPNCPFLPLDERIAMTRERRNSSGAVGPRGPVQLRSRELGRKRLRTRN